MVLPMLNLQLATLVATVCILLVSHRCVALGAEENGDLPPGVMRGPLLHEHSFQAPLVNDWWEEGVPHFMVGGAAIANEKFMRLTTNTLDDHGFAFNTAPLDHEDWEIRMKFSIRPPPPAAELSGDSPNYQGGDGLALWYLDQPIGDDHQHVVKYSKPITPEIENEMLDAQNPWRVADFILNTDDDDDDDDDFENEDDLTEREKEQRRQERARRIEKRKKREELFKKLFKRGTSIDESNLEPRIMGVKYSDFNKGFAIVLDSVGNEGGHLKDHKQEGDAARHHHHTSSIYLLLNLPNHTTASGEKIVNNFDHTLNNFRDAPQILRCEYNFRQNATKGYDPELKNMDKATRAMTKAEEPLELVVRYYKKKLTVIIRREDLSKRELMPPANRDGAVDTNVEIVRTYKETLCGEVYPITLPLKYHFGISGSTGHRSSNERKRRANWDTFTERESDTFTHVDVHDVMNFQLRELGLNGKEMGYSKTIPLEHFDFEADKREREHFSRQIPVEPDADTP